ncbi:hypothetical protein ES703_18426 [subsurface metagenome]
MTEVKLVIDGEEVILDEGGQSRNGTYEKYTEPQEYRSLGVGGSPLLVTVHKRPGWKPSDGIK